jgi:hypothetical protein
MFIRLLSLFAVSALVYNNTASAQIPGLTPVKAAWSTILEGGYLDGLDGRFLVIRERADRVIVDAGTGQKIKFAKPLTENAPLYLGGGRAWVWTAAEYDQPLCFDLATGKLAPHKAPVNEHHFAYVHATPASLIQRNVEELGLISHKLDGTLAWKLDLPDVPGEILPDGDFLAVECAEDIYLISAASGKVLAQVPRPEDASLFKFGLLPDTAVFLLHQKRDKPVAGAPATVIAADLKTGKTKWAEIIRWPADWKKPPNEDYLSFSDHDTLAVIDGKAYLACGSNKEGLRLITITVANGDFRHETLKAPGVTIGSLVRAGSYLCGGATLKEQSKEGGIKEGVIGFDPATLRPVWITESVSLPLLDGGIWSPADGSIVIEGYPMSRESKVAGFDSPLCVTAFKIPSAKPSTPAPK